MNDELDIDLDNLPEDVDELKQLIVDLAAETRFLREQFNLQIQRRFAASSEKQKYPGQHELFDEAEADEADVDPVATEDGDETITVHGHARKKPGRKPLPEDLPRVEVIHDLAEDEKVCSEDGQPLHCIGEEVSEQLDIVPARVQVIRHIRYKYACRHCETGITTAAMPPQMIPKSIATPGLLAWVAVSKYADALPLYRQETIFERLGTGISRTTLANWMVRVGEAVQPLIALMRTDLKTSRVIQMDETPVQVLKEPDKPPTSKSYMWVTLNGACDPAIVLYDYDPSRSQAVPARLLEHYHGYLVTDGYKGYGPVIEQNGITGIGCWAHVRRKFDEAQKVQGKQKTGKAQYALNEIRKLYAIEKQLEEKPPDEKRKVRQARAGPILEKLRAWLDKSLDQVPPKTALGKALKYADSEWQRLIRYLDDGELPIDNNRCENAIRPFVMGRKNWLFSNSQEGARASAAIYSLIESAKHNGLEPYRYLRYVFEMLPDAEEDELREMLPHHMPSDMFDD
jgi:transposase